MYEQESRDADSAIQPPIQDRRASVADPIPGTCGRGEESGRSTSAHAISDASQLNPGLNPGPQSGTGKHRWSIQSWAPADQRRDSGQGVRTGRDLHTAQFRIQFRIQFRTPSQDPNSGQASVDGRPNPSIRGPGEENGCSTSAHAIPDASQRLSAPRQRTRISGQARSGARSGVSGLAFQDRHEVADDRALSSTTQWGTGAGPADRTAVTQNLSRSGIR